MALTAEEMEDLRREARDDERFEAMAEALHAEWLNSLTPEELEAERA